MDLAIDLRQIIKRGIAWLERANQHLAQFLETLHVAGDDGGADVCMQARQAASQLAVFDQLVVSGDQPVEDDGLGPLLEAGEAFG